MNYSNGSAYTFMLSDKGSKSVDTKENTVEKKVMFEFAVSCDKEAIWSRKSTCLALW